MYTALAEASWYVVGLLHKHPAGRKAALITAVAFLALAKGLKTVISADLQRANHLAQSILQKAFTGGMTA